MELSNENPRTRSYLLAFFCACAAAAVIAGCGADKPTAPTPAACTFSVTPPSASFGASGGTGNASVTTSSGCSWRATSQAEWISVDGASHTGSGSISFTVAPSSQTDARNSGLTVAGQAFSVRQDGATQGPTPAACDVSLTANPDDFERDGGNGTVAISTRAGCAWTLRQDAAWLTVEGPTQGSGPATLKVNAASNEELAARRVTLAIADKSVVITQPGQGDCGFRIEFGHDIIELPRIPWTTRIGVHTSAGCRWTAISNVPWIHVAQSSGKGFAQVEFKTDENPGQQRDGVLLVRGLVPSAGRNMSVSQSANCGTAVSPSRMIPADGGRFTESVLVEPVFSCIWTVQATDTWIHVESPPIGSLARGDGDVYFTAPPNPSTQPRQMGLIIGERLMTIRQEGRR